MIGDYWITTHTKVPNKAPLFFNLINYTINKLIKFKKLSNILIFF